LTDWDEINWLNYNPLAEDTDGNGIPDRDEDADGDGLTNIQEANYGTNMIVKDTDHDRLTDYDEVMTYGTDPLKADTDGDGVDDGLEVALGSDPLKAETSFTTSLRTDQVSANPEAVDIAVSMKSSAEAAGSLSILPASLSGSPFVSKFIPGYLAAYELNADTSFDTAVITFTLGSEAGTIGTDFQPAIYCLEEETGILRKVEGQRIEGRKIIAEVSHFSMYVLLNSVEFDKVWDVDIRPPSATGSLGSASLDIVFVIDYSASMNENDSTQMFKTLSRNFVNKLRDGKDRGAVVKFVDFATVVSGLTTDKAELTRAINGISYDEFDADGYGHYGTDGSTGLHEATQLLMTSSSGYRYIIFLTDGQDTRTPQYSYDGIIAQAKADSIVIYTIGLGTADEDLLQKIASGTQGKYYHATASESSGELLDLDKVYEEIESEVIDMTTDSNNDGISDYFTRLLDDGTLTINGVALFSGVLSMDFTNSADWDGDGIKNGDEISIEVDKYEVPYINMKSNPLLIDSDSDGYSDYSEIYIMHTSPLKYTILPGDIDALRQDSGFPNEYLNLAVPDKGNLIKDAIKVFAGDQKKLAKEAFIDYFYTYATSADVLSRDAQAAARRSNSENMYEGINMVSNVIQLLRSAGNFFYVVGGNQVMLSEQAKTRADDAKDKTDKLMAKMLRVKKADIDKMNSSWIGKYIVNGINMDSLQMITYTEQHTALREELQSILDMSDSLMTAYDDLKKSEGWTDIANDMLQFGSFVLDSASGIISTLTAYNKIELPCPWEWLRKASDLRKKGSDLADGNGGRIAGGVITVLFNAADATAECFAIADTYGKIEANYAQYQKYLDLLRRIEGDTKFTDVTRDGAAEIADMFDASGEPNWASFDQKVKAAQGKKIAVATVKSIIGVAGIFFPVIHQVELVNSLVETSVGLLGLADLARTMITAEVYYSITDGSRALFNQRTTMLSNGYIESANDVYSAEEAGKYALQLAQSRITGVNAVLDFLKGGKLIGWLNRLIDWLFYDRSEEDITNEYKAAIKDVYDIARKCGMHLSDELPMYDEPDVNTM
ncbi:MAG: VWA domain-containing protein, partial [Synergistaceae bacterium]|nr:VWA domain-containing protein [Synergistaceae bacterium]